MVKIMNIYGDEYRGKQKHAVYQKRYGKQIRRLKEKHKRNDSPAQREQQRRFKVGLSWYKSLSYEEKEGLKLFLSEKGISLTAQQYAIKTALDRGKVSKEVFEEQVRTTGYMEGWDAEGWPYRQKIDITSQLAQDLVDFQVKLELNANNVGPHFRWDLQGRDLRFYDDKGTKIPYYIESWDEQNKSAVVWIKVPLIQQGQGADIYMYYGKEDAVSESDPEQVFEFYDDFEDGVIDTNKWQIERGNWTEGQGVLKKTNDSARSRILSRTTLSLPRVFEARVRGGDPSIAFAWQEPVADRNYYLAVANCKENYISLEKYVNDDKSKIKEIDKTLDAEQWHDIRVEWISTNHVKVIVDDTVVDVVDNALSWTEGYHGLAAYYISYFDYYRVRKYAEQEPTASFESEEYGLTEGWATIQVEHIVIEHSGMQNVHILDENGEVIKEYTGLSDIASGDIATRLDFINRTGKTVRTVLIESISGVLNKWTL